MLSEEGSRNLFQKIMDIWILPEIERRKQNRVLPEGFELWAAQILFHLDWSANKIRLNDEVRAIAKCKLEKGICKKKDELIYRNEIESIKELILSDKDDPNAAHVTLVRLRNEWYIFLDFRYNRGRAKKCLTTAEEFYNAAKLAYGNDLLHPFIDNLFSATELLATAQLLIIPDRDYSKKQTHKSTQLKYSAFVNIGNYKVDYKNNLNKLSGLRSCARYLKESFQISRKDAEDYLTITEDMIKFTSDLLK
ncbi:MAG: HEPN domain-containing protein [archaeon]|nr:HEPN domain-containing protein [archaeon]MCP8313946.1 HEPN domain-containing protein [archaeon]